MQRLFLFLASATLATAQTAALEGRVVHSITGEGVGKASVVMSPAGTAVSNADWMRSYGAVSDGTGKFVLRSVVPGKYRIRVTRNGFVDGEHGSTRAGRPGIDLDLGMPEVYRDIEVRLTPHGVIAGRVLDTDGEAMAQSLVHLGRSRYVNGRRVQATIRSAYTDDQGDYRFAGLTPGRYWLYAENTIGAPPNSTLREVYIPVYYPSAENVTGAAPLDVVPGATVRAGDIRLRSAPSVTVKGRVVVGMAGAKGAISAYFSPLQGHDNSKASSHRHYAATVEPSGSFVIHSLPPGRYLLGATVSRPDVDGFGVTEVLVEGTEMEGVTVTIGEPARLHWRVQGEGGFQGTGLRLLYGDALAGGETHRKTRIEGLRAGRYLVLLDGLADGFYVKSVVAGDVDVTHTGLELAAGGTAELGIVVSGKAGTVTGTAGPGSTVVLVPEERSQVRRYADTVADGQGRFTLLNVAPGEYKAFAWEEVEGSAWLDREFLKTYEEKGVAVKVAEGGRPAVTVGVIPAEP